MYTKYEVSMSNHVPGKVCTDNDANEDEAAGRRRTKHDCKALWLINQMSEKVQ